MGENRAADSLDGRSQPSAADLASLAVCSLIWGTTWRGIKLQMGVVPVFDSVVYRFALASALLFGWCVLRGRPIALTRSQHLAVLRQGACGFTLQYGMVYLAEERISSGAMAVIFSAVAFANLVLFRIAANQRASRQAWIGTLLGLAGVAVMSWSEVSREGGQAGGAMGVILALAAVAAGVFGNYFAHRAQSAAVETAPGTAWAMGYGAALLAVVVLVRGDPWVFEPTPRYVGALLYLAVFGSVIAFVVFYGLARRRGYGFASYVAALTPPTAMLISWLFEGTQWGLDALAGLILVLGGQVLLIRGSRA